MKYHTKKPEISEEYRLTYICVAFKHKNRI